MASIVSSYGGQPIAAPSMREVPLESNPEAIAFADALERGEFDLVILLTGVGTRALVAVVERVRGSRDVVRAGPRSHEGRGARAQAGRRPARARRARLADRAGAQHLARGAVRARREAAASSRSTAGGSPCRNTARRIQTCSSGLEARGARVTRVPVYQWALPDDLAPLEAGVRAIVDGQIDVVALHDRHSGRAPAESGRDDGAAGRRAQRPEDCVVASIGPTTSEEMREQGIEPDLEPTHPRMGFLVREAAERAGEILRRKRA